MSPKKPFSQVLHPSHKTPLIKPYQRMVIPGNVLKLFTLPLSSPLPDETVIPHLCRMMPRTGGTALYRLWSSLTQFMCHMSSKLSQLRNKGKPGRGRVSSWKAVDKIPATGRLFRVRCRQHCAQNIIQLTCKQTFPGCFTDEASEVVHKLSGFPKS